MIARMQTILPGLSRWNVGTEVLAGITLLAIALPLNIGYAQIAGLPPSAGLYALVLPSVRRQCPGSSRCASPHRSSSAMPRHLSAAIRRAVREAPHQVSAFVLDMEGVARCRWHRPRRLRYRPDGVIAR